MNGTSSRPSSMIPIANVLLAALECPAFPEGIQTLTGKPKGGDAIAQYDLGGAPAEASRGEGKGITVREGE